LYSDYPKKETRIRKKELLITKEKATSLIVKSVVYKDIKKYYYLAEGSKIETHRFSCLGRHDKVVVSSDNELLATCLNGNAIVKPLYREMDNVRFGEKILPITIKEIDTEEELQGFLQLEQYHYRGKSLHGRKVPLIATTNDPLLPLVIGYIELASSFIMNKPRNALLNGRFYVDNSNIGWELWNKEAATKWTNLIVRIARTVVSPEYRGLGISRLLVRHAISYARNHWFIGRMKPLFIEITADMLRYVPFVESCGMHYIGETEGNLHRVQKDMEYLLKNYSRVKNREILREESGGIVDQQVTYVTMLKKVEDTTGIDRNDLLSLLVQSPESLSDTNWALLHKILRLPKPTYLLGLSGESEEFVVNRLKQLQKPASQFKQSPLPARTQIEGNITLENYSVRFDIELTRTNFTRKIQQSFGVNKDMLSNSLFKDLCLTIEPGEIVLICGPSGVGKTMLLSILMNNPKKVLPPFCRVEGVLRYPDNARISVLSPIHTSKPLVNAFGNVSLEHALHALNTSGLSEAHLYLKKFSDLSNGQRYRAMVAKLIASNSNIWIADEFCATLDPITANIVTRNLRKCAKHLGVTALIAAANWSEFIDELKPDKIIHIRSPWDVRVFNWIEFKAAICNSAAISRGQL
jgi:ABC-type ATPase with predicted acetyltransferase domain